jgi:hypothetical protein
MMASGEIRLSTTTMRRMPVLAQSPKPPTGCWNASVSSTVALSGPVAGPVGVGASGGTGVGFSYGGSLLNSGLFLQVQAAGTVGSGIYAGWSATFSGSQGSIPDYISSTGALHTEGNFGVGVGGGYSVDLTDGSASVSGYRGGLGVGAAAGLGGSTTTTVPLFTIGELLQFLGVLAPNVPYPFSCH